ncbi:TonB-dependent receptor plug domain-containing protein [Glaciecola sp. 1036]|uniref:TonB-dependent receptor plug domain-containing protein n=1 Tax=Alteromonadaceae TaxID=72275 RepID=UPI003D08ED30
MKNKVSQWFTLAALFFLYSTEIYAQQVETESQENSELPSDDEKLKTEPNDKVEHVLVVGEYIGIEVPEAFGRFTLSESFVRNAPKTTGDINDLIALLPGVQLSEDAFAIGQAGEIKAKPISISGAQPWQTGFFIDGMNYNSRLDPAANSRSVSSVNDVQGGVQTFNINSQIVQTIDVYDSNIPVQYGGFSGGVVEVETRSSFDVEEPKISLGYRSSRSDWNRYNMIIGDQQGDLYGVTSTNTPPQFTQHSYNVMLNTPISNNQGLLLSANYTKSIKTEYSLSENVNTQRDNVNLLIKYSIRDIWFDKLDISATYAPYENLNILRDTLNSNLTISGGGYGTVLNLEKEVDFAQWRSKFSANVSENSRAAPQHFYLWNTLRGKEWGQLNADASSQDNTLSREGGYGNLDKTQQHINWQNSLSFKEWQLGDSQHFFDFGISLSQQKLSRERSTDSYYYNSAKQYSTELGAPTLNCSGYTIDCVELVYIRPLDELEAQIGGPLDFNNLEHVQLYSDNIAVSPQYFQFRIVYPVEDIEVDVNQISAWANYQILWQNLTLNLGLRYDYDDFFQNHTIAPRISGSWDWFDDNSTLLVFGANRYYDAGLATYKLKQEQQPYYTQFRPILNNSLQAWVRSSRDANLRYLFNDVDSPYNDEITLAWKQHLGDFGYLSVRGVYRWQRDQLARAGESVLGEDGYRYAYQENTGYGTSKRLSLAWNGRWQNHSFWANTDFSETFSSSDSYDAVPSDVGLDEIVWYESGDEIGRLATRSDLNNLNTNFARPLKVNFGWHADWTEYFSTSMNGTYTGGYDTAVDTGSYIRASNILWLCDTCEVDSLEVPLFRKAEIDARWMVNLAAKLRLNANNLGTVTLSVDVSNVFNSRTYLVSPGNNGIETGRTLWVGAQWDW